MGTQRNEHVCEDGTSFIISSTPLRKIPCNRKHGRKEEHSSENELFRIKDLIHFHITRKSLMGKQEMESLLAKLEKILVEPHNKDFIEKCKRQLYGLIDEINDFEYHYNANNLFLKDLSEDINIIENLKAGNVPHIDKVMNVAFNNSKTSFTDIDINLLTNINFLTPESLLNDSGVAQDCTDETTTESEHESRINVQMCSKETETTLNAPNLNIPFERDECANQSVKVVNFQPNITNKCRNVSHTELNKEIKQFVTSNELFGTCQNTCKINVEGTSSSYNIPYIYEQNQQTEPNIIEETNLYTNDNTNVNIESAEEEISTTIDALYEEKNCILSQLVIDFKNMMMNKVKDSVSDIHLDTPVRKFINYQGKECENKFPLKRTANNFNRLIQYASHFKTIKK